MGILVVNSDFEKLWGEPQPSIQFDNSTYSLAGEVGTELSTTFAVIDNNDVDVSEQCEFSFSNDYVSIEEDEFVCDGLEVGTYETTVTATYVYKSATVTATATINISVQEQQPTSISFNSSTYSMSGNEDETLTQAFSVSDDLSNDVTALCSYSFSPNDKGLYVDSGNFKVDSAIAGTYDITVTATYGELTNTATISVSVVDLPNSISFDSNSYTMTGTEYDTITQSFTVTDDLNNDLTSQCSYTLSPNDTGLTASNGTFDASSVTAGTYSVTVTATYAARNLTATATIGMEIASAQHDYSQDYLTFEALESGTFTLTVPDAIDSTYMTSVSYSTDNGTTWVDTTIDNTAQTITTPTINAGSKVLWKGIGTALSGQLNNALSKFTSTGNFNASGNIMSLLYGDNFVGQTSVYSRSFRYIFGSCTKLTSIENIVLPATTLADYCYQQMFYGCTSLTTAPSNLLPATTLSSNCYSNMFQGCTSLTTAPELPATTLADGCYFSMFMETNVLPDCTNIDFTSSTVVASGGLRSLFGGTKVTYNDLLTILPLDANNKPTLPVTTLSNRCYNAMFQNCTSLTTAPTLPATTLTQECYSNMFQGCTKLTTAPELPATTLVSQCYSSMFNGCTNLNSITMLATDISAFWCLRNWVTNVAATGTFTKAASMTTLPSGDSGIPTGWTVVDAS